MRIAGALGFSLALLAATSIEAVTFTRIADATSSEDWDAGVWFGPPAIDQGHVAFFAAAIGGSWVSGVYLGSGGPITTVADSTMPIPGGSGTFQFFSVTPAISGRNTAFLVNEGSYPTVFASIDGALTRIAPFQQADPSGNGNLQVVHNRDVSIDRRNVAFMAVGDIGFRRIYTSVDGALEATVDETTPVASGGDLYLDAVPVVLDVTSVAFHGTAGSVDGIYVADGGATRLVADTNALMPGVDEPFTFFDDRMSSDAGNVVFIGGGKTYAGGVFAEIDDELVWIAHDVLYDPPAIHEDVVAFHGADGSLDDDGWWRSGIYVVRDGQRETVIEYRDVLDGKTVDYLGFGAHGLSDDELAFTAHFTDRTSGVYRANLPEPTVTLHLAVGTMVLATLARKRARAGNHASAASFGR